MVKKIVAIGPESTGKSTLCEHLASSYRTIWCPEYAREYLQINGTDYTFDDLLNIAKGQIALENQYTDTLERQFPGETSYLFIDTDMYVMKVWCEFVFGKCHPFILDQIVERKYDFYLLCDIDIPWTKDGLREYPDLTTRQQLFHLYKDLLVNASTPWITVSGNPEARLEKAIYAIQQYQI